MADSTVSNVTTGSNLLDHKSTALVFTDADFAEKPLSHKIGVSLPIPSDSQWLQGPNTLQWMTFVETMLQVRLLFKHCSHPPLSSTSPHFVAWQAEEHFFQRWLLNQTLHPNIYSKFRNRLTVKDFWDQAKAFGGSDRDNWRLFGIVDRLGRLTQGPMSIADYSMAHRELWDDIDYYAPGEQTENADRRVILRIHLLAYSMA